MANKKKAPEERLTGAVLRLHLRAADRQLIERAARASERGEISEWCRSVLIPAAQKQLLDADSQPCPFRHLDLREVGGTLRSEIIDLIEARREWGEASFIEEVHLLLPDRPGCLAYAVRGEALVEVENRLRASNKAGTNRRE